jgi:hypothetical protein
MPYTLKFSDSTKQNTISIPDMPPGINTVDTSLALVGRGYPNYGQKFAENFLHLLENFASPLPPENPIEGQLWYDTSDPYNKVLRIMDGTASSVSWPSANGIYRQGTDPINNFTIKIGDLWVDTSENKLKIWNGFNWQLIGPPGDSTESQVTGSISEQITDTNDKLHWVIKNYIDGDVVSVISGLTAETFTPNPLISGFSSITPGINLNLDILNTSTRYQLAGTSFSSTALSMQDSNGNITTYNSDTFLRKDDTSFSNSSPNQEITGFMSFRPDFSKSTTGQLGLDGVVILPQQQTTEFVQLYKSQGDAVLLNNTPTGQIKFQVNPSVLTSSELVTPLIIDPVSGVSISGNTQLSGNATITGVLSVSTGTFSSTNVVNTLTVARSIVCGIDLTLSNGLYISTTTFRPATTSTSYNIGTASHQFNRIYVKEMGSTSTTFYGRLKGSATLLENASPIRLQGQVDSNIVNFTGTSTGYTFTTTLSVNAITDQTINNTGTDSITMLVVDTSTSAVVSGLSQISRKDFLKDIAFVGMMVLNPKTNLLPGETSLTPPGWFLCDGSAKSVDDYPDLYNAIGTTYGGGGGNFNVPNLNVTIPESTTVIPYIIRY